jgi:hypothetical protein
MSFPQWDKKTPSEARCIDLTRWPLPPGIELAFPAQRYAAWHVTGSPAGLPAIEFPAE